MSPHDLRKYRAWCRVELGMPESEFLELCPADLFDLVDAWEQKQRREDTRIARLQLTIATSAGAKSVEGRDLRLADFLPWLAPKPSLEPVDSHTLEQQFLSCIPKSCHPPQDLSAAS